MFMYPLYANQVVKFRDVSGEVYSWDVIQERMEEIRTYRINARFFRHSETEYNVNNLMSGQSDVELTPLGRQQALDLAKSVPEKHNVIYSSNLSRAKETAEIVAKRINYSGDICVDKRFSEVHLGELEGKERRAIPQFSEGNVDFAPRGGESYRQAAQRVFSAYCDLVKSQIASGVKDEYAVVFCHAGLMRVLVTLAKPSITGKDMFRYQFTNHDHIDIVSANARLADWWVR